MNQTTLGITHKDTEPNIAKFKLAVCSLQTIVIQKLIKGCDSSFIKCIKCKKILSELTSANEQIIMGKIFIKYLNSNENSTLAANILCS